MKIIPQRLRHPFRKTSDWSASPVFSEDFWSFPFSEFRFPSAFDPENRFFPSVDVSEKDNSFIIEADIPNVDPEDVRVEIEDDGIIIQGETTEEKEEKEKTYHYKERVSGSFYRKFPLPSRADMENIECISKNGTLTIIVPKKEGAQKKTIPIEQQ